MKNLVLVLTLLIPFAAHAGDYNREICRARLADGRVLKFDANTYPAKVSWSLQVSIDLDVFPNNEHEAFARIVNADDQSLDPVQEEMTIVLLETGPVTSNPVHDSCYVGTEGTHAARYRMQRLSDYAGKKLGVPEGLTVDVACEFYAVKGEGDCAKD
jgi:hypothetical protein